MNGCITGIGSRKTPGPILRLMTLVGAWCLKNGIFVRTGHADGADYAFEQGAKTNTILYLPWYGFNSNLPYLTKHIVVWDDVLIEPRKRAMANVERHHPAPHKLRQGAKKLMARNYFQLAGSRVSPNWSNAVVCWTPGAKAGGGTGQAIRLADIHDVPVLDLGGLKKPEDWTLEDVTEWITSKL